MDLEGKTVLILGGFGLVGFAICRKLVSERPARMIVASLKEGEAREAVMKLKQLFPDITTEFRPAWGNVFLRTAFKDLSPGEIDADPTMRKRVYDDILLEMSDDIYENSFLASLIEGRVDGLGDHPADVVIDCINTATGIAYQNIYARARQLRDLRDNADHPDRLLTVDNVLGALYTPKLVRHIQILLEATRNAGTYAYVKVGTTGTGGMGLNIPYSHGERQPSRMLLAKSAISGAHTQLLFLMARTEGAPPIVKEIKPAAMIGWKAIGFGPICLRGRPIPLYDCPLDSAYPLTDGAIAPSGSYGQALDRVLESVYIDTGENGLFSAAEFAAITTLRQMEMVTAEEIATAVVAELKGMNTGCDVLAAMDAAVMGPTYRAGVLREAALQRLHRLEQQYQVDSIAFEILGPPRLSKLLFEANLLRRACGTMEAVGRQTPEELSQAVLQELARDVDLRAQPISVGIPILLPDGKHLLRGPLVKAQSAHEGWIDLTPENMATWQKRLRAIRQQIAGSLGEDTSSWRDRVFSAERHGELDDSLEIGEIAGWVFIHEDKGGRVKR